MDLVRDQGILVPLHAQPDYSTIHLRQLTFLYVYQVRPAVAERGNRVVTDPKCPSDLQQAMTLGERAADRVALGAVSDQRFGRVALTDLGPVNVQQCQFFQ